MAKIIRPKRQPREGVRRPAWLYPEGTVLAKKGATYRVTRTYGIEMVDGVLSADGFPTSVPSRSARFWEVV